VLVDANGEVIAGHGRLLAAQELGLIEAPVIELSSLTPAQVKAYRLADNKLALDGGWDDALLGEELLELQALDYNLDFTGFDPNEVMGLVGATEAEEVPAPEPPENPVSRVGDVWVCGSHRVMCGDSASVEDVDRLLAGAQIHLAHCDPPYNVNVEPRSNNAIAAGTSSWAPSASAKAHLQGFDVARQGAKQPTGRMRAKDRPLQNDFMSDEAFDAMLLAWFGNIARVLLPGRSFYIWGGYANWKNYCRALAECGLYFSQGITWVKNHPVLGRKDLLNDCEYAWYGWREGAAHRWFGPNNVSNVWCIKKVSPQAMVHITEKPIELAVRAIEYSSKRGESVLDLFGGSGSTLIGAEQTGRRAYLMELDPAYTDVIVMRWIAVTGEQARLEGGETFEDVRRARGSGDVSE
jgi:DNA modification methylase